MLAIRILNGPQAGQIYIIKNGRNRLGRSTDMDFQIQSAGISKDHFEIQMQGDRCLLTDNGSSNGTYLNGVRIKNASLKIGDKLAAHNILMEVIPAASVRHIHPSSSASVAYSPTASAYPAGSSSSIMSPGSMAAGQQMSAQMPPQMPPAAMSTPMMHQNIHHQMPHSMMNLNGSDNSAASAYTIEKLQPRFQKYIEQVVMPAIYRLTEVMDFKTVIFGFAFLFLLIVTVLSSVPMNIIAQESILTESKRRALTIARSLASANERAIRGQDLSRFSTDLVMREDGLEDVYVISKDGTILAPSERNGSVPKQAGFIKSIRGSNKELALEISSGYVGATAPILSYDMDLQENKPIAHVVVIYNMGGLKYDDSRAFGLFIQIFVIALMVGTVLFYLMYKLIEYPFIQLNTNIDTALKENLDHTTSKIQFPILQALLINLNSMLHRVVHGSENEGGSKGVQMTLGLANVVQLVYRPTMLLNEDGFVISCNSSIERHFGMSSGQLSNQSLEVFPDISFQLSIKDLIEKSKSDPSNIHTNALDFSGHLVHIRCQNIQGLFFITLAPADESNVSGSGSNGSLGGAA